MRRKVPFWLGDSADIPKQIILPSIGIASNAGKRISRGWIGDANNQPKLFYVAYENFYRFTVNTSWLWPFPDALRVDATLVAGQGGAGGFGQVESRGPEIQLPNNVVISGDFGEPSSGIWSNYHIHDRNRWWVRFGGEERRVYSRDITTRMDGTQYVSRYQYRWYRTYQPAWTGAPGTAGGGTTTVIASTPEQTLTIAGSLGSAGQLGVAAPIPERPVLIARNITAPYGSAVEMTIGAGGDGGDGRSGPDGPDGLGGYVEFRVAS